MSTNQYESFDEARQNATLEMAVHALPTFRVMAEHGSKMAQFTVGEAYSRVGA
jgi:hypothetical protein